ncbi:MAG: tRNA (guanosine(46)-N7)-methyltransferase TrmB [Hydrogenovibrio sp.]|uniref:tRNA (guanosine(46)-N7)-methyltransferase TrmB n=1 Tax=Hydrogenovibrio sp. TaxID=2065821 RepID=UPI0028706596|nr:tRNA (guanosine(46)-N7)-methyltransferase TrmB [Hydrogenovibrio sp.]MDR9498287.1 tRNA (guanosine(46)-N7)-methyltransferase TrmB [Hydrogenovibrio sp.]
MSREPVTETDKPANPVSHRIKSFVLRQGRLSKGQKRALETYWPQFGCERGSEKGSLSEWFGREAPTFLEIGFGMGHSLVTMAQDRPEHNFIGIEVHRPGVGALLKDIGEQGVENVRVFNDDAVEVLASTIPENSLAGVYVFFPDPWHKKRHHKRRLIQPGFLQQLARFIQPGGTLHLATDWEDYAEQMMSVASDSPWFDNTQEAGQYTPRPDTRPLTKFEKRGHNLGHGVWDLVFQRNNTPV